MMDIQRLTRLDHDTAIDIRQLAQRAERADQVDPFNESAWAGLDQPGVHLLAWVDSRLAGYGVATGDGSAQLVVDPAQRRHQVGSALLGELRRVDPAIELWSFDDLVAAQGFAQAHRLVVVRELLVMGRALPAPPDRPLRVDPAVSIRAWHPGDLDALVSLNARAFADHPEQGRWTRQDVAAHLADQAFDPAGLLIAHHDSGVMAGFHWTIIDAWGGQVYVLGVDPDREGQGLGRRLLHAGLDHLTSRGASRVRLWVEGNNKARTLYETAGFSVLRRDVRYRSSQH
jgi:mycothiol synthase